MTRAEHVAWCKQRAREYAEAGDLVNAVASMGSDLCKHPETRYAPELIYAGVLAAKEGRKDAVISWIEGFQ